MSDLRARRHSQTREDIVDAGLALFGERGYDVVTMEDIATAAGISRSTVYRHFPTKEDVVVDVARQWLEAFDAEMAALPDDVTAAAAFARGAQAVAHHIDENLDRVRAAYAVLDGAPTLKVSGVATTAWLSRMTGLAQRFGGFDDEAAAVVAGAYLGGIDAMMTRWAAAGGRESVVASTKRLNEVLGALLVQ